MSEQRVPTVPAASRAEMWRRAEWLVRLVAPERLTEPGKFPAYRLFDRLKRYFGDLDSGVAHLGDGVEGCCTPDGQVLLSEETFKNLVAGVGRARFTAIHEICHGLHHRQHVNQILIEGRVPMLYRRSAIPAYVNPEWQADTFASAVLMPAVAMKVAAERHTADITFGVPLDYSISQTFGVSRQAAEIRIGQLGLS